MGQPQFLMDNLYQCFTTLIVKDFLCEDSRHVVFLADKLTFTHPDYQNCLTTIQISAANWTKLCSFQPTLYRRAENTGSDSLGCESDLSLGLTNAVREFWLFGVNCKQRGKKEDPSSSSAWCGHGLVMLVAPGSCRSQESPQLLPDGTWVGSRVYLLSAARDKQMALWICSSEHFNCWLQLLCVPRGP